ncbi:MAG: hypothetical protein ROY99_02195 [Ignavibacterium sp.]|jgi:hypothetical protein|nr:hypothetical protein [Ignavibacterium sp.]
MIIETKIDYPTNHQKPLVENTSAYCFIGEIERDYMGDGVLVVKQDECDDYPCSQGFVYSPPKILSNIEDILWLTTFTNESGTRDFCPDTHLKGGETIPIFDNAFDVPFNSGKLIKDEFISQFTIDACFNIEKNKWQYLIKTNNSNNEIKLRVLVAMCHWSDPTDIVDVLELNNIPENEVCLALKDFEKNRPYQFIGEDIPTPEKYYIKDAYVNHEKVHVKFFQLDITKTLQIKHNYYGVMKSFSDHLKLTPECTEKFKDKNTTIYQGKKYYNGLLKDFCVQLHSIYRMRTKDRRKNENMTQWNDDVQNTINYYQNTLKEIWKNKGRPINNCDYEMDWSAYEQYKNKF